MDLIKRIAAALFSISRMKFICFTILKLCARLQALCSPFIDRRIHEQVVICQIPDESRIALRKIWLIKNEIAKKRENFLRNFALRRRRM